jgi:hypothetical protein
VRCRVGLPVLEEKQAMQMNDKEKEIVLILNDRARMRAIITH